MTRYSKRDVELQLVALQDAMERAGIQRTVTNMEQTATLTANNVRVEAGSPTYGRAWRVYYLGPYGAHYEMPWSDYIGWSASEAWHTLHAITAGINAALEARA